MAGFSDSDANFNISYSTKLDSENTDPICYSIALTFRISQRQEYHRSTPSYSNNYYTVMSNIAEAFDSKVENINRNRELSTKNLSYIEKAYLVRIKNKSSRLEVIKYFDKFNLLSSKNLDFLAWKQAHQLVEKREYRSIYGSASLIYLKSSMNLNRTYFNWKHLEDYILNMKTAPGPWPLF